MSSTPLILGHRGASALAPENTLAAFARAIEDGADGIEFDVRLSRDGLPVVIHDDTLKRTGLIDRAVLELTAAELQQVDVGSWFARRSQQRPESRFFSGQRLPLLSQVFALFSRLSGVLYVEMKCETHEGPILAAQVVNLIHEYQLVDRTVVESFDLPSIQEVKRIDAGIRTAALFEPKLSNPISTLRRLKLIDRALDCQADEIALHHTLAGTALVESSRTHGLDVVVWTVDELPWIDRAKSLGVKALISNDPGRMVKHRSSLNA